MDDFNRSERTLDICRDQTGSKIRLPSQQKGAELACLSLSYSAMQQVSWKALTLICLNVCSGASSQKYGALNSLNVEPLHD